MDVPVTLKTRLGWDPDNRNIGACYAWQRIAAFRRWRFMAGRVPAVTAVAASYELIRAVKAIRHSAIANGDMIRAKGRDVLACIGADADHDWPGRAGTAVDLFREIGHFFWPRASCCLPRVLKSRG